MGCSEQPPKRKAGCGKDMVELTPNTFESMISSLELFEGDRNTARPAADLDLDFDLRTKFSRHEVQSKV